jgi:hypothetical protein
MDYAEFKNFLESEWEPEAGFFWKLRQASFDEAGFERILGIVGSFVIKDDDDQIPRRLVSLLWYAPLFMTWQTQRLTESGLHPARYQKAVASITNEVERLLGVP